MPGAAGVFWVNPACGTSLMMTSDVPVSVRQYFPSLSVVAVATSVPSGLRASMTQPSLPAPSTRFTPQRVALHWLRSWLPKLTPVLVSPKPTTTDCLPEGGTVGCQPALSFSLTAMVPGWTWTQYHPGLPASGSPGLDAGFGAVVAPPRNTLLAPVAVICHVFRPTSLASNTPSLSAS